MSRSGRQNAASTNTKLTTIEIIAATSWLFTRLLTNSPMPRNMPPASNTPRYEVSTGRGSMPNVHVCGFQSGVRMSVKIGRYASVGSQSTT